MKEKFIDLSKEEVQEALESYWGRRKVGHCVEVVNITPSHNDDGTFGGIVIFYIDNK